MAFSARLSSSFNVRLLLRDHAAADRGTGAAQAQPACPTRPRRGPSPRRTPPVGVAVAPASRRAPPARPRRPGPACRPRGAGRRPSSRSDSTSETRRPGLAIFSGRPGESGAAASVRERAAVQCVFGDGLQHRQRVQEVLRLYVPATGDAREVDARVPLHQFPVVAAELRQLRLIEAKAKARRACDERLHVGWASFRAPVCPQAAAL